MLANHPRWVIKTSIPVHKKPMWTTPYQILPFINSWLFIFYSGQPIQPLYSLSFSQILSLIYSLFLLPPSPSKPCFQISIPQYSIRSQISLTLFYHFTPNPTPQQKTQIKLCNINQNHHFYSYYSSCYRVYHLPSPINSKKPLNSTIPQNALPLPTLQN